MTDEAPKSSLREDEIRELRIRYSTDGYVRLVKLIDNMKLGELPEELALFLVHASNAANWEVLEDV